MKFLLLFLVGSSLGFGQTVSKPADLPFSMVWLRGRCGDQGLSRSRRCNTAAQLESIQFTTDKEAWGVGHRWPPPKSEGIGDFIAVHSQDGGRTWVEIPYTQAHAASPSISFLNADDGLLSWPVVVTGAMKIQRTRDGGKSWQDVDLGIDAAPGFVDESHWFAIDNRALLATDDAGRTWREMQVPHLTYITSTFLNSRDVGWIASNDFKDVAVSRTIDGGRSWTESRFTTPSKSNQVTDLFFVDALRGWLIVDHGYDERGDASSDLFSSVDGGATWVQGQDRSFQGAHNELGPVRFLSPENGFVFDWEITKAASHYSLIYTTDGGAHWRKQPLPHYVYGCQIFKGELRCSAGGADSEFWILTIRPK
jgi:photosystem II stability/assembly factor-like uncharacterized protein